MTTHDIETQLGIISEQVSRAREDIKSLDTKIDNNYVTRKELEPIKNLVYGFVSLALIGVVGGLLTLVIRK